MSVGKNEVIRGVTLVFYRQFPDTDVFPVIVSSHLGYLATGSGAAQHLGPIMWTMAS